jgi:hypothetical protein
MACEQEKQWLAENFEEAPQDALIDAVDACCGKLSMDRAFETAGLEVSGDPDCEEALHALAAASICNYYTGGNCPPCCSKLAGVVAPILAKSVSVLVDGLHGVWDGIKSLVGGGGCDYDPAANQLVAGYGNATVEAIRALAEAWYAMRLEAFGQEGLDTYPVVHPGGPGGRFVPTSPNDPGLWRWNKSSVSAQEAWEHIVVHNAKKLSIASDKDGPFPNGRVWRVKGKSGYLLMPGLRDDKAYTPWDFYYFWWTAYPCEESANWESAARDVTGIRWHHLQRAIELFTQEMLQQATIEMEADMASKLTLVPDVKLSPSHKLRQPKDEGMSGAAIAAIALGAIGLGYAGYLYRDEIFGG